LTLLWISSHFEVKVKLGVFPMGMSINIKA
jgi:hypothetical protein